MVESTEKTRSTVEGNGKPLQYSCLENPMNSTKKQKDMTLKDELPRLEGAQYAAGEEWRNNSRNNEILSNKTNIKTININAAAAAKSLQSCPTLCNPLGCPIRGILQARTLE